jgi:hypothetical protein
MKDNKRILHKETSLGRYEYFYHKNDPEKLIITIKDNLSGMIYSGYEKEGDSNWIIVYQEGSSSHTNEFPKDLIYSSKEIMEGIIDLIFSAFPIQG